MPEKSYDIYQRTFEFARDIVRFCLVLSARPGIGGVLCKRLVRAGTSVGANVAEAQMAQSRVEFAAKASQARKEMREVIFWLRLIEATHISDEVRISRLLEEAQQLQRMLLSFIRHCRS